MSCPQPQTSGRTSTVSVVVLGAYSAISVVIMSVPLVGSLSTMERPFCADDAPNTPI